MLRGHIWPGLGRGQCGDTTALGGEKVNGEGRGAAEAGSGGEEPWRRTTAGSIQDFSLEQKRLRSSVSGWTVCHSHLQVWR